MTAATGTAAPRWRGSPLRAVLFDLDGTLIDTAGDIATALNRSLAELGCAPAPTAVVRDLVGRGAARLISRALARAGIDIDAAGHERLLERFLHHYARLQAEGDSQAEAYPGAADALAALRADGLRIAVVTNKQHRLAAGALDLAGLGAAVELVIGGDTCARRKPDPLPLLHACATFGVAPAESLMVGDSINDVLAARAAGVPVLCVPYGYNEGADPRELACDGFVESLADLPALLRAAPAG